MNLTNEYIRKREEGMGYSEMWEELTKEGYDKEFITDLINEVDEQHLLLIAQKDNKSFSNITNGLIRLIIGICLLLIVVYFVTNILITGVNPSIGNLGLISFCFTGGFWFYSTGKKAMKKALKKKIKLKNEDDLLC